MYKTHKVLRIVSKMAGKIIGKSMKAVRKASS